MSWMAKLYQTYEFGLGLDLPDEIKLMPVSHTMQNAHINIVIDGDGNFKRALILEKTRVVLPATEQAAGRTCNEEPYSLADKIQYVACDYPNYGGRKKSYYASYETQLSQWCSSAFAHPMAIAVHNYIRKGQVVADLVSHGVLHVDENNKLSKIWPEDAGEAPPIFKVLPKKKGEIEQGDALVGYRLAAALDRV
jgi:CRISPR-associated protein Csd1